MSSKGIIPGYVILGAALALLVVAVFFIILLKFYSSNEITISDKIADGLSSINYFYLTEKNINEFAQIVTGITAKELGEACGGFDCYKWSANNPSYQDLRNKFEETLRGKITGFPAQMGNGGRISFAPPRISGLEMDESGVKISLFPQQVYRKTDSFLVNASSEKETEIDNNIRYLLLARIGQELYGNGTYVRDSGKVWINSGKFDCNGIMKSITTRTQLSSRADLEGCKILNIDFNVDDLDGSGKSKWNGYGTSCYGIANSADPGVDAGKVGGGKIYVRIDSLLEKSLICGIDATDGLASATDNYGEVSKSSPTSQPSCTEPEAGANAWQKANMPGKMQTILDSFGNMIKANYAGISIQSSANIGTANSYSPSGSQAGWNANCGSSGSDNCGGTCTSAQQYCRTDDKCAQQASFTCSAVGNGCYGWGSCGKHVCTQYSAANNAGYCCPAEAPVFDAYTNTCFSSSGDNLKIEAINKIDSKTSKQYCDSCTEWIYPPGGQSATGTAEKPGCGWSNSNSGTLCSWTSGYDCAYYGSADSGRTSTSADYWWGGSSMCGGYRQTMSRQQNWGGGIYSETRYDYHLSTSGDGSSSSSTTYSCRLAAYFKFTFTPDISFKITDDTGNKIVEKGTTNFDSLYFAVKFKPAQPYVIGG